ncbi:MAG: formate acetyltransferase [Candidatus Ancillula sp.]|jgi:formate C-acetyltransferase|nr:formate acetyltransferase [Candidatus Ancillula sp.]
MGKECGQDIDGMFENYTSVHWRSFKSGAWSNFESRTINVRNFIQNNLKSYSGSSDFLAGPSERTLSIWKTLEDKYFAVERSKRVFAVEKNIPADINAFTPGYISQEDKVVVGLQTDQALKRPIMPLEGWRSVEKALNEIGEEVNCELAEIFTKYVRTHNDTVFKLYTPRIKKCRSSHILSALPDNAARGRLIGDYRRLPLYGLDYLVAAKLRDLNENMQISTSEDGVLKLREELQWQISALKELGKMANTYGFDISKPAQNSREAVQWLYFAYLGAIKQQDGAAMSVGRIDAFLDIYFERDLAEGTINEQEIQELVDNLVIKLRIVRFLRMHAFDEMYSGDPMWATVTLAGISSSGVSMVTKTSYRILQTLYNLGPAPEPNLTVLWHKDLPENFKNFCTCLSIETSTIQYENDDLIREAYNDDTSIACCVSPVPKSDGNESIQLFGARMNGLKALLYGLNGGRDELTGVQIFAPEVVQAFEGEVLDFETVWEKHFKPSIWHLTEIYIEALNIIHYSHDRYFYESLEMALHDTHLKRTMGCGLAGLSHIVDSLSAIKYAKVTVKRDETGLITGYEVDGDFPTYGNDDDRADDIAKAVVQEIDNALNTQKMYRDAIPTLSLLTITANVTYGKKTGDTPDGRKSGTPLAPGANPSNGVDHEGVYASMLSVGKIPFSNAYDGISLTTTILPSALGDNRDSQVQMLKTILDRMFIGVDGSRLYHTNINVLTREILQEAFDHPEDPRFNNLCIRISGYCVLWNRLTTEQRLDILNRTFHAK